VDAIAAICSIGTCVRFTIFVGNQYRAQRRCGMIQDKERTTIVPHRSDVAMVPVTSLVAADADHVLNVRVSMRPCLFTLFPGLGRDIEGLNRNSASFERLAGP
jgi:hypothetical protein